MPKKLCILIVLLAAAAFIGVRLCTPSSAFSYRPDKVVRLIFDTDIDTDVDDMGALAVLHSYVREGRAELLAAVGSCRSGYAAACIDAVNTYYGLPDIPVGIAPECPSSGKSKYQKYIAENYENDIRRDEYAPPALQVYRECLAKAEENSVVIVVVGPLNNLCALLRSGGDEYSPLTGTELVGQKVKLCVVMGGKFPESDPSGEYNARLDPEAAAFVARNCPVSVMWSGWEVGKPIKTGGRIGELDEHNPVRTAYELYSEGKEGFTRSSWDLTAVMYAVEGADGCFSEAKGTVLFGEDAKTDPDQEAGEGYDRWVQDDRSKDAVLVPRWSDQKIAGLLDERMVLSEGK